MLFQNVGKGENNGRFRETSASVNGTAGCVPDTNIPYKQSSEQALSG
jgi:hypothetical protein